VIREIIGWLAAAAVVIAVAYVGCGSVQEAHDSKPTRVLYERETVF
jgi:hypothetical protein